MPQTKNIFLKVEYVGTRYNGWQTQREISVKGRKSATIQQTIENVLKQILQQRINLTASGRTDSGVHAKGQCANFKAVSDISLKKMKTSINSLLPQDIRVKAVRYLKMIFIAVITLNQRFTDM